MSFIVIVGNIGIVYDGHERKVANDTFNEYKSQSKTGYGRASCEQVVLLRESEILREYLPPCDEEGNPLPPKKVKDRPRKVLASTSQLDEIAACLALAWERAASHNRPTFEETNRIRAAMVQAQRIARLMKHTMKTIILLLSASILLCSCDTIVNNRNAKGQFINPPCPTCKAKVVGVASIYLCEKGHKYRSEFKVPKR